MGFDDQLDYDDMTLNDKVRLFYRNEEENSDKVYVLWIEKRSDGKFVVLCAYGRRGSSFPRRETKVVGASFEYARHMLVKVLHEKLRKGYIGIESAIKSGYLTEEEAILEVL